MKDLLPIKGKPFMFIIRTRNAIALLLAVVFPVMGAIAQEKHVVPLAELHHDAAAATESRQADLAQVEQFFSSELAQKALNSARINGEQVKTALPLLSNEELAKFAQQTSQLQTDFAGGALSNLHLTYIVIALATAVIILVILKA